MSKKQENKALRKLAKEALTSSDVCQDWKNKILEVAPSLEVENLEVGKWYRRTWNTDNDIDLFLIKELSPKNKIRIYNECFFRNGSVLEVGKGTLLDVFDKRFSTEPATKKEVFEALKKEAIKIGVWNHRNCKFVDNDDWHPGNIEYTPMLDFEGALWSKYGIIFKDGKWATPIETITKAEAEKQLGKTIVN